MTNTKQNKADSRTGDLTNKLGVNLANSSIEVSEDERYNTTSEKANEEAKEDFLNTLTEMLKYYVYKEDKKNG